MDRDTRFLRAYNRLNAAWGTICSIQTEVIKELIPDEWELADIEFSVYDTVIKYRYREGLGFRAVRVEGYLPSPNKFKVNLMEKLKTEFDASRPIRDQRLR